MRKILGEVQRDGITAEELKLAKSKIASRVVRGSERPMGRMQAIAAAWTYTGEYRDVDTELANYDAVTLADVRPVPRQVSHRPQHGHRLRPAVKGIGGVEAKTI